MANLIFWEKRGCLGNAGQKALLRASGHLLDVRDLREEVWTPARLRPFFGDRPIAAWFNPRAPKVVRREVRPETLDEAEALAMLVAEPLLIRRPLLAVAGPGRSGLACASGFDPAWIEAATGAPMVGEGGETCPREAMGGSREPAAAKASA